MSLIWKLSLAALLAAGLGWGTAKAEASQFGWVYDSPYRCALPTGAYPVRFHCQLAHAHSINVRIPTTGGQRLEWELSCLHNPEIMVGARLPSRLNYFFSVDQSHNFIGFDVMSFDSCQLFIKLWLLPGSRFGKWKIVFTDTLHQ
jgi:hypothetical protein